MSNEGIGVRGSVSVYGIGVGDREIGRTGPSPGIPRENGENGAIAGYPPRLAQTIVINIVNPFKIFGTPLRPNIFFKIYENFPFQIHGKVLPSRATENPGLVERESITYQPFLGCGLRRLPASAVARSPVRLERYFTVNSGHESLQMSVGLAMLSALAAGAGDECFTLRPDH